MPKTDAQGDPRKSELPSTLQRSSKHAQDIWASTYDSAMETYDGDDSRAAAAAWASLKHSFEKVGDHWQEKDEKGPSDDRAAQGGPNPSGSTAGGVDANASKDDLYAKAQDADIEGRSSMTKDELVDALRRYNERETRRARESD
jgi:cation transport regulator ChaB